MVILQFLGVVKADPTSAGFELAPTGAGAMTGLHVHDGEHTNAGIGAGAAVVGTRTLADIQIPDADLHKEGTSVTCGAAGVAGVTGATVPAAS